MLNDLKYKCTELLQFTSAILSSSPSPPLSFFFLPFSLSNLPLPHVKVDEAEYIINYTYDVVVLRKEMKYHKLLK